MSIHYFENEPMFYKEGEVYKGIEVEILNRFAAWMKTYKGVNLTYKFQEHAEFNELFSSIKTAEGNHVGAGTVTRTAQRAENVDFSAPYLRNVSVMVTASAVKTARNQDELKELLGSMKAFTVKGSVHEQHLISMYKEFSMEPRIAYVTDPSEVFKMINESPRNFGYVDVITFWKYLKTAKNPVKMHKVANSTDEYFGFIFPKDSGWAAQFNEFFESGFGFTSTKEYHKMLEKYLSFEILKSVELLPY
jgi:putative glutamine transport system substrate-binding protein